MTKKNNIKIIFVDLDWTLFDHNVLKYAPSGLRALRKAKKKGVKIIISTARCYPSLEMIEGIKKIPHDGYLCSNGGIANVEGKYLFHEHFDVDTINKIIEMAKEKNEVLELITPNTAFLSLPENSMCKEYYDTWYEYRPKVKEYEGEEVTSIVVFCKENEEKRYGKLPVKLFRFYKYAVDITPCDFYKSNGVKAVLNYYGFSSEDAMAIGDDTVDIDMLKCVKYSIAMGNGKEEVKKVAYFVTDSIEKHGVKKALKHFRVI